jgi:ferredoxin
MAYVITDRCVDEKNMSCVDVCPVDCIHPVEGDPNYEGAPQLYIDPVECIDCSACVPECPVEAIFAGDDLPEELRPAITTNREYFDR